MFFPFFALQVLLFKTTNLSESRIKAGLLEFLSVLYSNLYPLLSQSYYSTYNYNSTTTVNGYISLEMGQKENFLKNTTTPPCYQNKSKLWEDTYHPMSVCATYNGKRSRRQEKTEHFQPFFSFYIYCKTVTLLNWIDLIFEPPPLFYFLHCCYLLPTYIIREEPHIVSI